MACLLASVLGTLILIILLALFHLEDTGARERLLQILGCKTRPSRPNLHLSISRVLESIPVPGWFPGLSDPLILKMAGIRMKAEEFDRVRWLAWCLGLCLGILGPALTEASPAGSLLGLISILVGTAGPRFLLQRRTRIRKNSIERALPDFLDLLTLTVEAGQGLVPALRRVSFGSAGPLSREIENALLKIELGSSRGEALQELARSVPSHDLENFLEAILLSERLGTSLSRTLRVQASLLRTRRRQRAERQAQTAPIRVIPALVFFFLPGLLLIYLAPPIINFLMRR